MRSANTSQQRLRELLSASGLQLADDEVAQLAGVYERFRSDRERLAAVELGDAEPATIFPAPPGEGAER